MDIHLLKAFVIAAEERSFSIAAERLHITQSAVSKRIALLEQQLSLILFDRVARKVYLTESGELLLPRAKLILDTIEDTQRYMAQTNDDVSGELRLATSHHIGIHRLPPVLKEYRQRYPNVHLQLQFIDSEQAETLLLQDKCDLAVTTLPSFPHSPARSIDEHNVDDEDRDIQYHKLWDDPLHIVASPQHPILQQLPPKQRSCQLKQLLHYPVILPDVKTRTTQLIRQHLNEADHPLNVIMTSNHLDAIKMMVTVGLGWSVLPEKIIDDSLRVLPIKNAIIIRELGCLHHRNRTLSNAARAMLHCMQDHIYKE
ncbi:MAG: DNA-binding transcriptional LysR family regulator [Candidatus Endobugula sp.]|jgi:DNA-binding transcriptional LysR family regulator